VFAIARLLAIVLLAAPGGLRAASLGGFELTNLNVDREHLVAGGPGKDKIRTVDAPEFSHIGEASWIGRDTEVLGIEVEGEARAYPVRMLEYHQIVNDVVGGVPIAVTYDPLAGTPIAYRRRVDGRTLVFGVSGLLYNHNFLFFDRETESLWSQFLGRAVAGPLAGKRLERVTVHQETAGAWIARHMESLFMRPPFPEKVFYQMSPYAAYWIEDKTLFPLAAADSTYHAKELVLGVVVGDTARAYVGSILTRDGGESDEKIDGKRVRVLYDSETGTFHWDVDEGVLATEAYWLAWKAFHPETEIWHAGVSESVERP
jgi:hypothetical protein